jgi:hypothetical protein
MVEGVYKLRSSAAAQNPTFVHEWGSGGSGSDDDTMTTTRWPSGMRSFIRRPPKRLSGMRRIPPPLSPSGEESPGGGLIATTAFIAASDLPLSCERRSRSFHITREAKPFVGCSGWLFSVAGQTSSVSKKNQRWPSKSSARYRRPGGPSSTAERIVAPAVFARSKCRSRLFT